MRDFQFLLIILCFSLQAAGEEDLPQGPTTVHLGPVLALSEGVNILENYIFFNLNVVRQIISICMKIMVVESFKTLFGSIHVT